VHAMCTRAISDRADDG